MAKLATSTPHGRRSKRPHANYRQTLALAILDPGYVAANGVCRLASRYADAMPAAIWEGWPSLLAEATIAAGLTIAAAWIGLHDGRWWQRIPICVILFPATLMVVWLSLWRRALRSPAGSVWDSCKTRLCQAAVIVASLAIVVPPVGVCWRLAHPRTLADPPWPVPNGYDELVRAAALIKKVNVPNFETATHAQFKSYVTQCAAVYAPVRAALDKPCQVPLRVSVEDLSKSIDSVQSLRRIGRALYAQGRLAAMDGRNEDAVRSYTDTIRLGCAAMRNGLVIDALVGITFEGMGHDGIAKMRTSLSAEECLALLPKLSELLDQPVSSADILAREAAWADNAYGWQCRLANGIDELFTHYGPGQPGIRAAEYTCNREQAQSRLLLCELAIRAYSLQHRRPPATLADLVPAYLPRVPKDPFHGGDFIYRPTPTGYELHSSETGINGRPITADDPG